MTCSYAEAVTDGNHANVLKGVMYGPEAIKMMEEKAVLKKTVSPSLWMLEL